jgi:hypothetical protein
MNNKLASDNDAELDAVEHEQNRRANVDRPTFARVKCLVISELIIATLFGPGVCQEVPDVML